MKSLLSGIVFLVAGSAFGAESADTTAVTLGEVSVTAIKQSSSLLRQPVTVTTVSAADIERWDISGMKGVTDIAPNFYMPDYGSRMTSSIYVRGIGARIDQPAVGLNIDNIPYLNKNSFDIDMADVERIEVLRGPQSTLYGRNTIAGQVNVYTMSPLQWEGVRMLLGVETNGSLRDAIGFYKRLGARLGMSVNFYNTNDRGYFRNRHDGRRAGRGDEEAVRWRTVWHPSEVVNVENVFSSNLVNQQGYAYSSAMTGKIDYNDPTYYNRKSVTDGVTVSWATPWFTFASITGFQYLSDNMTLDQDFLPVSYFTLTQRQHERSVTQDIVLRGSKGAYSWLAGAFGFYKYGNMHAPVTFKGDGIADLITGNINKNETLQQMGAHLEWDDDHFVLNSRFRQPVSGFALYHRSAYDLGPVTFAAGVRFDYEHSVLKYGSDVSTSATMYMGPRAMQKQIDIHDSGRLGMTFREVLPTFSVTYNLKGSAMFLSASKGYKAGGYNTQMFSDILQSKMMAVMGDTPDYDVDAIVSYRPEVSWNYEFGGHFSCDGGRVYSTFSAFYIDVRDQQVTLFPEGTTTGRMMANAGRSRSWGGEFTLRYTPSARWRFDVAYGYTNARFVRFNDGRADLKGKRVPYAPSNTLFASASYRLPLRTSWADALVFAPDVRGTGSIYWDEENLWRQPFYAELGMTVRLVHRDYSVELWGKNLTDTRFDIFRFESIGNTFFQRGRPIRGGITLRLNLGSRQ